MRREEGLFRHRSGRHRLKLFDALDARRLALPSSQIIQLGAADASLANHLDRADHGRMRRENALDADAKAHAAHRETLSQKFTPAAHHHALERLNAFLVAFAFFEPHVHANRVSGTKYGKVFAEL